MTKDADPGPGPDAAFCAQMEAVYRAIENTQKGRQGCLKSIGEATRLLGTMEMQVRRRFTGHALTSDSTFPPLTLQGLQSLWDKVGSTINMIQEVAETRASQSTQMDSIVLELRSLLLRSLGEKACPSSGFASVYEPRDCSALKAQLTQKVAAQTDELTATTRRLANDMKTASDGIKNNKCWVTPATEGCWMRTPSGCPNVENFPADTWVRDNNGELAVGAGVNYVVCLQGRKAQINQICGVTDTEMMWFPVKPVTPGCYVLTPNGCTKHAFRAVGTEKSWTLDTRAVYNNAAECDEQAATWNSYCGIQDAKMLYLP